MYMTLLTIEKNKMKKKKSGFKNSLVNLSFDFESELSIPLWLIKTNPLYGFN